MQTDRDRSLVEHLATKVKGWHRYDPKIAVTLRGWYPKDNLEMAIAGHQAYRYCAPLSWNPIESWADAGQLWELHGCGCLELTEDGWEAHCTGHRVVADSGPRAICEAVAKATGWEETT